MFEFAASSAARRPLAVAKVAASGAYVRQLLSRTNPEYDARGLSRRNTDEALAATVEATARPSPPRARSVICVWRRPSGAAQLAVAAGARNAPGTLMCSMYG